MAKRPCSVCGTLRWASPRSRPDIVCQDCRRQRPPTPAWAKARKVCLCGCGQSSWGNFVAGHRGRAPGPVCVCVECGSTFNQKPGTLGRYCSTNCSNRATGRARRKFEEPINERERRAQREGSPGYTRARRRQLLALWRRQHRTCTYCPSPADTVDHVVPLARGGTNYEGNLVPACRSCNSRKRDQLLIEWRHRSRRAA